MPALHARPASRAVPVTGTLVLTLLLTACGGLTVETASPAADRCPESVHPLVDETTPASLEITLAVDTSTSFLGQSPTARRFVAEQVTAVVEEAVDRSAALRVITFAGSAGSTRTVVECPVLAARYRNDAAREAKVSHLERVAATAVWTAVLDGRPAETTPGTSVVGGFVALADAPPLTDGPRRALMLSDGLALPELDVRIDLSGFERLGMYGIGHSKRAPGTPAVDRLTARWRDWLGRQGARQVTVSSQGFSRTAGPS